MPPTRTMKKAIQHVIRAMMDRVMQNVLERDPFIAEKHQAEKPLYAALVPDEIFKGSHFERRFVTPFGKVWERLAEVAAQEGLGHGECDYRVEGLIREGCLHRIQEVLNRLEHASAGKRTRPAWVGSCSMSARVLAS